MQEIHLPIELHHSITNMVHNTFAHKAGLLRNEYVLHFILDDDERLLYKTEAGKIIHIAINAHPLLHQQRFIEIVKSCFNKNSMLKDLLHRTAVVKKDDAVRWWGINVTEGSIPDKYEEDIDDLKAKLTIFTKIIATDPKTKTSVEATFQGSAFFATPQVLRLLRDKINARVFLSTDEDVTHNNNGDKETDLTGNVIEDENGSD